MQFFKPINCQHCGEVFSPKSSLQKCCSPECRFRLIASHFKDVDGCWNWPMSKQPSGYGQIRTSTTPKVTVSTAHRMAYTLFVGPIPDGLAIMHMCDNRACFNPAHLKPGTLCENNIDMMQKGRAAWNNLDWNKVMISVWKTRKERYGPSGMKTRNRTTPQP